MKHARGKQTWITTQLLIVVTIAILSGTAFGERVKDTHFSHDRGFYSESIAVRIETSTREASIFYTVDGSMPSPTNGNLYETPVRISTTTTLRAAAFKDGMNPTNVDTLSFILPLSVLKQTGEGMPKTWGVRNGEPVMADYAMDPEITESEVYRDRLLNGLTSIPTVSLVLDPSDWLDPARGVYANPTQRGVEWERPVSLEMLYPPAKPAKKAAAKKSFQIDCGLRIQGGWNRRPEESPKHSMRLLFKKRYQGSGKLKKSIFPEPSVKGNATNAGGRRIRVKKFDTLILRGGNNNTWLHRAAEERARGDYIRDQWMRDTFTSMGQLSAQGRYVHVYINGLYWGVYNLAMRPDGSFLAAHDGGSDDDYDARNGDKMVSGDETAWNELMEIVNSEVEPARLHAEVGERLDLANFADYMLLNLYAANGDYDSVSNWYAGRPRKAGGKFRFFVWDGERTNEDVARNTIDYDSDQSPPRIFQRLRRSDAFRRLFAERVQLHCFDGGVLTAGPAAARLALLAQEIETALVSESARWGDYRRDVHRHETSPFELYTTDDHWRPEVDRLLQEYFPARTQQVVQQFRSAGLFPE